MVQRRHFREDCEWRRFHNFNLSEWTETQGLDCILITSKMQSILGLEILFAYTITDSQPLPIELRIPFSVHIICMPAPSAPSHQKLLHPKVPSEFAQLNGLASESHSKFSHTFNSTVLVQKIRLDLGINKGEYEQITLSRIKIIV